MKEENTDSVKNIFVKYLNSLGLSSKSHKNYRSDLSHFANWTVLKIRSFGSYVETLTETVPFLSNELAQEYKNYMVDAAIPNKTINRRLSTLRHFGKSLLAAELIDLDFTSGIENISEKKIVKTNLTPIISEFGSYLEAEKISKNTIKNYLSDTRQFLAWLEANQHLTNTSN